MKRTLLAAILFLVGCSQQRFEVLQQGTNGNLSVVYDRQTQKFIVIGSGGNMAVMDYPTFHRNN